MSTALPAATPPSAGGRSLRVSGLSDELLARYAARGSQRAFGVIYERYHQALYRYCRSIVRDETDAQDVLQSTFTAALAALQRHARTAPLRPWLYRIAHNESISLLRRRTRDAQHQAADETTMPAASAADEAAARARWRGLLDDLALLPERQRGALLLREMAGLSHEEIAVALGVTLGGAKQAIFEARQALAEVEEGRSMSCDEVRRRISEGDRRVLRGRRIRAHLRECAACEAFALAIPARQAELRAIAPALPAAASAAILGRVTGAASSHGGTAAGSAATAGALGKAAGAAVGWKALAGAVLVAGAAAGAAGLSHVIHPGRAAGSVVERGVHSVALRRGGPHHVSAGVVASPALKPAAPAQRQRSSAGSGSVTLHPRVGAGGASSPGRGRSHAGAGESLGTAGIPGAVSTAPGQTRSATGATHSSAARLRHVNSGAPSGQSRVSTTPSRGHPGPRNGTRGTVVQGRGQAPTTGPAATGRANAHATPHK